MKTVALGEVASINPRDERVSATEVVSFVGMAELDAATAVAQPLEAREFTSVSKGYTVFRDGDVLAAKITPCWENGKVGQARLDHPIGVGSTEFHVLRPTSSLDDRYLLHFLRQPYVRANGELRMTGSAGQRRVPVAFLQELQIPLPPLHEQRRIAAILDHADALRAKRHQVLTHLDSLTQSIFNDMFSEGDFPLVRAGTLMPNMRNGLSPATAGTHDAQVLTLSSVTQGPFDPSAVKPGVFAIEPPSDKRISDRDFLMCRGNGNKALVGVGTYSRENRPDLVFPDTVIAGAVDTTLVKLPFLESAWKRRAVRSQVEAVARTTSGTFKVNQKTLGGVLLPVPPLGLQEAFGTRVARISVQQSVVLRASRADDELFTSLQARAFQGEL